MQSSSRVSRNKSKKHHWDDDSHSPQKTPHKQRRSNHQLKREYESYDNYE